MQKLLEAAAIFLLLFFVNHGITSSIGELTSKIDDGITPFFKFVATVEGKSYFAENDLIYKSWTEARNYCKTFGMQLATIASANQWKALEDAFDPVDFYDGFWTSGREARELKEFNWDLTNMDVDSTYIKYETRFTFDYFTCLSFYSNGRTSYVYARECSIRMQCLCETT